MLESGAMTSPRHIFSTEGSSPPQTTTINSSKTTSLVLEPVDVTLYVLSIFLFAISCYVFFVVCIYLHRFLRKRRLSQAKSTSFVLANGFGKLALCMRFVVACISLLCLVHFILEQILLHSDCCDSAMMNGSQIVYGFVIMLGYIFFWLRQRVLYDAPAMRLFTNKLLRILSWLSLAFVLINGVAQIVTTCILGFVHNPIWIYFSWLIGCVMVQGALMALFMYPLLKHGSERRKVLEQHTHIQRKKRESTAAPRRTLSAGECNSVEHGIRDSNIFTVCASKGSRGSASSIKRGTLTSANPMYRAARRCVVCAAVAFVTDVAAAVFMILSHCNSWNTHEAESITRFLFNLNLVVNSTSVLGCFANWRYILFPEFSRSATNSDQYLPTFTSEASIHQRVIPNHYCEDE